MAKNGSETNPQSTEVPDIRLNWKGRFQKVISNITVEPILVTCILPRVLCGLAAQNLSLEKACRVNMDYGDVVCDALSKRETQNYTIEEETVQQLVAKMAGWKTVIQSIFPCLLILFWGSWSDRHCRRKPCILLPIVGEFLATVGLILCKYIERTPMEVVAITETIFPSLSGGWFTMLMGVFSYIADITTEEERTFRVGILNLCLAVGAPISMAVSGVALKKIGFYGVFWISASFYLFSFFYGLFFLSEPRPPPDISLVNAKNTNLLIDFFNKDHAVETFKVAFKRGENQRRKRFILLMIVVIAISGPMCGESSVLYLFVRYRFNWSEVEFSIYSSFATGIGLLGVVICVGILSHKLKIQDPLIGVISSVSKILSGFVYGLATVAWHMYVGAIVEIFNGTASIAMRSLATKLVGQDEVGKVNSLFAVVEALLPMLFAPIYTNLYAATLSILPGIFFIVGGIPTLLAILIFLWMYNFQRKLDRLKQKCVNECSKEDETNMLQDDNLAISLSD